MIRINLAPERGRRRKVGFKGIKLGLPAFNLGMLFGVVYLALVLGIGMYWWFLISTKASLTAKIDNANRELTALKAQIGQESKVRDLALELRKRVDVIEAIADFMSNLRSSGKFKDVDLVVTRRDLARPSPLVTFEVTCRYEG